jgi:hypothetical protein
VDDALLVGRFEGLRNLFGDGQRFVNRDSTVRDSISEGGALDEFHNEGRRAL